MKGVIFVLGYMLPFASFAQLTDDVLMRMQSYERTTIDDCKQRLYKNVQKATVVYNGTPVPFGEFAHIAALGRTRNNRTNVQWFCAGSLIWLNFILTAAHCTLADGDVPPDVARLGDINIYSNEDDNFAQEFKIVNIITHPKYRYPSSYYDIALMELDKYISPHTFVLPACLWLDDEIRFPTMLAAGWGRTGLGFDQSEILLKVELGPISKDNCSSYYPKGNIKHRKGLMDHQLCAGDEKRDTCPGDSGGPLHVNLLKDNSIIPFIVGVTSFGKPCGIPSPGVYTKVSKFKGWIIETLQQYGESVTRFTFHPMVCAERFREGRGTYVENEETIQAKNDFYVEFLWPPGIAPDKSNCAGTLIEPYVVLTTAECILQYSASPTKVFLTNNDVIDIVEIIVHPLYNPSISPYYNNLAVLKLKNFGRIAPYCGWYGPPNPGNRSILIGQRLKPKRNSSEPEILPFITNILEQPAEQCHLAEQYTKLLPEGLKDEHLCYEHQFFTIPGSCNALQGSPIERHDDEYVYIVAIHAFGRDCGYGEPAIGVRLSAHKEWLESVLLPRTQSQSLVYVDTDRKLSDECEYPDRTKGTCVAEQNCPAIHVRLQNKQQIIFCTNRTIVCCPHKPNNPEITAVENEFNKCEARYRHLRTDKQNERTHLALILFQIDDKTKYLCDGYLISTRGVLSSASCLLKWNGSPSLVRVGGMESSNNSRVIRIEKVTIHPRYDSAKQQHDIAILKLESAVNPTEYVFPVCLWQNITHSPVMQSVLDFASRSYDPIHPMYKSDCEALLGRSFDQFETICLNPGYQSYMAVVGLQITFKPGLIIGNGNLCYSAGSPIVYREPIGMVDNINFDFLHVKYLVGIYSHGGCGPTTPRIVNRVAAYIEWFKEVLQ